ncbi:MAG TPA: hypothetical protein VFF73_20385 [Planctomycetota bacterium]|nr:hypothetical protein [Planctomycetota bacterium]
MKGLLLRRRIRSKRFNIVCRLCGTPRPTRQQVRNRGRCRACAAFPE